MRYLKTLLILLIIIYLIYNKIPKEEPMIKSTQDVQTVQQTPQASAPRSPIHEKYRLIIEAKGLQIPPTIWKIHGPHLEGDQDHIHFRNGASYGINGKWDYDNGLNLSRETMIFIEALGFPTPQRNDAFKEDSLDLDDQSPTTYTVEQLKTITGLEEIPPSVRAVHEGHGNGQLRHIHFHDEGRSLNVDGTWELDLARDLTLQEEEFALKLGFTLQKKM